MRIFVHRNDSVARDFVVRMFDVLARRQLESWDEFGLPGGGLRPVLIGTAETGEVRGAFSCRTLDMDDLAKAVGWHELCVKVQLNPQPAKKRVDARSLRGQLERESKEWVAPKSLRGRGGAELYERLVYTGRIVQQRDQIRGLRANSVYAEAGGFDQPVVAYGTSDAANVFELLEALKAGWHLGLPVVFDQYESAHTVGDYWQQVMRPSLLAAGLELEPEMLGLDPAGKFTQLLAADAPEIIRQAGLFDGWSQIGPDETFASWQRKGMLAVASRFQLELQVEVQLAVVTMESLLQHSPYWWQPLRSYAWQLQDAARHEVGLVNTPNEGRYMTGDRLPGMRLADIHKCGWWLAGSPINQLGFSLGQHGGVVHLAKDNSKGQVNRLAEPFLGSDASGLHMMPVGLFRLHAVGQDEDASVDPWVFLTLIDRWGAATTEHLRTIWGLMEVPLAREHVGRETRVAVGLDGLDVRVTEP